MKTRCVLDSAITFYFKPETTTGAIIACIRHVCVCLQLSTTRTARAILDPYTATVITSSS
ncbi:MAG: hypothetical protein HOG45_04325 [Deltaproteobacteria bacterium]|nr:hypothetical protein [Deltaproteobacteria bacterium]